MKKLVFTLAFLLLTISSVNAQWVRMSNGIGNNVILSVTNSGNNILAGTWGSGIYFSTNNGVNWTQTSLNNRLVWSLSANPYSVFAGTADWGVYISNNNGMNWTQTSLNNRTVHCLSVSGNNIFAGTETQGIYVSNNNGMNWTQTMFLNNPSVYALASLGNYVYAGVSVSSISGVYISTDNGTSWTQTSLNGRVANSIVVSGNNIFAGTDFYGVYLSTNNGSNWTQTSLNNQYVRSLAVTGNSVFAGVNGIGVFVSNDNGANWTSRIEGLGYKTTLALCIYGNYIFAGTQDSGVYRRPLSELITEVKTISNQIPKDFSLLQNYPNPFNPSTSIRYEIPKNGFVKLVVYDILGKEIETLVNEKQSAGTYEVKFEGKSLTSGVYFYRLTTDGFSDTKRMILLK